MADRPKLRIVAATGVASGTSTVRAIGTALAPFRELPDDHPYLAVLGRLTIDWAHVEHLLDSVRWKLADDTDADGGSTSRGYKGHGPLCGKIGKLAEASQLPQSLKSRLIALKAGAETVAQQRNRLVHDAWYYDRTSGQPAQYRKPENDSANSGIKDVDMSAIADCRASINEFCQAVEILLGEVGAIDDARRRGQDSMTGGQPVP